MVLFQIETRKSQSWRRVRFKSLQFDSKEEAHRPPCANSASNWE